MRSRETSQILREIRKLLRARAQDANGDWYRMRCKVYAVLGRCSNEDHPGWCNYGGRGVYVHQTWVEDPNAFIEYLLSLPGSDDPELVLDRTDNEGAYVPGNLRFVTPSESQLNKRKYSSRNYLYLRFHQMSEAWWHRIRTESCFDCRNLDLEAILSRLDHRSAQMLIEYYCEDRTYEEIGARRGMSKQRVHEITNIALAKLRRLYAVDR